MGLLSVRLTNLAFQPIPGLLGDILTALDGQIVITSIDQFPAHSLKLSAGDIRAVRTIDPTLLPCGCIISEEGLGEVARGYITSPSAQITESGHDITLTIPNVTEGLLWDTTSPGWVAATGIDTIAARLASRSPPWTAGVVDTGAPVISVSPVHWTGNDPATSNVDLNSLTKNHGLAAGWNVGAISTERATSGDCAVSSVAFGSSTHRMFGFATGLPNYSFEHLNHAMYFSSDDTTNPNNGLLEVWENGVKKASLGTYAPGDLGTVAIEGGVVKYKINDVIRYTSTLAPSYPAFASCSIFNADAAILGATFTQYVAPKDVYYAVGFENATILDALIQLATRTFRHIRQAVDANGVPQMRLELGLFNAAPTMVLKTSDGESPSQVRARNSYTRLIGEPQYTWDTSEVISIGAVYGGGQGDTQVTLESLWRIINDPTYPGYGHYGPVPDSIFPEYDAIHFPIERRVSLNGTYFYTVKNVDTVASLAAKGHWSGEIWGPLDDSSVTYVDQSPYAQKEAVERTLYVSAVTKLKRHAILHFSASVVTDGRGRITQAGDQVNLVIRRTGTAVTGFNTTAFQEVDININPIVTSVVRHYADDEVSDQWALSTLGRVLDSDESKMADFSRQMEALRIVPTTSEQTFVVGPIEQSLNSVFPLEVPVRLPTTMFRMTSATWKVVLKPVRHNVKFKTIEDGEHDHPVAIPPLAVDAFSIIAHNHTGYTPYYTPGNYVADIAHTGGTTDINHAQGTSVPAARGLGIVHRNTLTGVTRTGNAFDFNPLAPTTAGAIVKNYAVDRTGPASNPLTNVHKTGTSENKTNVGAHVHYIQVSATGASAPANQTLDFVSQSGGNSFIETRGGAGGNFHTDGSGSAGSNSADLNHSHADGIGVADNLGITDPVTITNNIDVSDNIIYVENIDVIDAITIGGGGNVQDYVGLAVALAGLLITAGYFPGTIGTPGNPVGTTTGSDDIGTFTGVTVASNTTTAAKSGKHTHALGPDIVETQLGGLFQLWINSGDGVYIDRSAELGGPWTASVDIPGSMHMERFLQAPGREVGIRVVAVNTAGNPTGLCNVQVSGTFELEKTAVATTIYAQ